MGASRVVVAGVPRAGKTTLSRALDAGEVRSTDELIGLGWSEASEEVSRWLGLEGPWIIEGVATVRALRKWLRRSTESPCDLVLWIPDPRVDLTSRQWGMANAVRTIWAEIVPNLKVPIVMIARAS